MKVSLTNVSWKNPCFHKICRFIGKVLEVEWSSSRGLRPSRGFFCPDQRQHYHQLFDIHPKVSVCKPNQESAYKAEKVLIRVDVHAENSSETHSAPTDIHTRKQHSAHPEIHTQTQHRALVVESAQMGRPKKVCSF